MQEIFDETLSLTSSSQQKLGTAVAASVVSGAVGVPDVNLQWFVAIVKNNTEKATSQRLVDLGYNAYLPIQKETRVWKNGRKATIDRVVIPSVVFIRCTDSQRKEICRLPYINRFMVDRASSSTRSTGRVAVIPDRQMQMLQFMVGNSDEPVEFSSNYLKKGDAVRVVRGRLAGLEGEVHAVDEKHSSIVVRLDYLGSALLTIETINIQPIK